jgi:hypothetical protein
MRPTKRFEQLLSLRGTSLLKELGGTSFLKDLEEYECDICGAGYALEVGWCKWNCSVPQKEHKEWGEFWLPGYHICFDCCEAGVASFPDRLRKHVEALEERAAELRKLVDAKWVPAELYDEGARDNDPIPRRFHISE